mmetsp:Transcript_96895/g.216079  ORF Transcript_96895/g.216079 Transcript_96895/m.216079 type:complete len:351 (+) Transcript_96895:26-1078(+)
MGCGLVSQRGPHVEVHHPLRRLTGERVGGARRGEDGEEAPHHVPAAASASHGGGRMAGPGQHAGDAPALRVEERGGAGNGEHSSLGPWASGAPPGSRRFTAGERVVLTSRLPSNIQDHAFCFECGVVFQLSSGRSPQCSRCGSTFVQYLRGSGDTHWVSPDSASGRNFNFDDQLDNSISASLDEAPVIKKPTQGAFLKSMPSVLLGEDEIEKRSKLGTADPRCNCAICRESFATGEVLRLLPCNHEFHETCIITWLQSNNTCPICRWKAPEATDEEDEGCRVKAGGAERSGAAEAQPDAETPVTTLAPVLRQGSGAGADDAEDSDRQTFTMEGGTSADGTSSVVPSVAAS